jgi:hypothetical protein
MWAINPRHGAALRGRLPFWRGLGWRLTTSLLLLTAPGILDFGRDAE